jgi:hypothetical protein
MIQSIYGATSWFEQQIKADLEDSSRNVSPKKLE